MRRGPYVRLGPLRLRASTGDRLWCCQHSPFFGITLYWNPLNRRSTLIRGRPPYCRCASETASRTLGIETLPTPGVRAQLRDGGATGPHGTRISAANVRNSYRHEVISLRLHNRYFLARAQTWSGGRISPGWRRHVRADNFRMPTNQLRRGLACDCPSGVPPVVCSPSGTTRNRPIPILIFAFLVITAAVGTGPRRPLSPGCDPESLS